MSERQDDPTIGRLVADASRDVSALVQTEIALAKSELKSSAISGGLAAGLFAAAGFILLLILILLSITFAYFLTMTGLHPAWAFLIVAGAYFLLAVLMVAVGVYKIKKIKAPTKTIESAKAIPAALRGRR
ncbi:MAG: phage holin family protein [Aeromicrobium sp.]